MRGAITLTASLLFVCSVAVAETAVFVAPGGSDSNAGTREAPLQTLEAARVRIRALKQTMPDEPIVVYFAEGLYPFTAPVAFSAEDSGTASAPITYRAWPGHEVRLSGGVPIARWRAVSDPAVLNRLPEAARAHVQVADLKAQGISDYGKLGVYGFSAGSPIPEPELFYADEPMTLARWPNDAFRGIQGRDGMERVQVDTDRVARWTEESDPWVFAYWHHDWAELHEPIVAIDAENRVLVRSAQVRPQYGITPANARWYAYNLLSELDMPGEYYLDRENGKLYFWPPTPGQTAVLSRSEGVIRAENLSYVTFQGFAIEACRATAVTFRGGRECRVVGCTIRNVGQRAVSVSGGECHEVFGCDIYHCGEGGISMQGGDRPNLAPAGHNAENNHVYKYSRRARTYKSGISVDGVGNRIAHNLVHDGPHMALSAGGNDHIVEFNEIHNVVYESGDAGAYYVGRDWTQRGNVLRYNYWHQIVGGTGYGGMTIYLDDQHSGHTIKGNVFEKCSRAVFIGGGDDNIVTNNVFRDCWRAAHIDNRGMGWQKAATDDPNGTLRTRFRQMPVDSPLWRERYPTLAGTLDDEPNIPKRNVFARNISAGGTWNSIHQGTRSYQTIEDNLVFDDDPDWVRLIQDASGRLTAIEFKDPAEVERIGFQAIPVEKIGLYDDPRRASWPVAREVRPVVLPK